MGRKQKFGEPTKTWTIRIPESMYNEVKQFITEYLKTITLENEKKSKSEIKEVKKESKNYYEILGVNRNTSENDIKMAYKRLAKKYHPDLNKTPEAKERFIELQEAYSKLLNPEVENIGICGSIFDSLFKDKESGINFFFWDKLVRYEDFGISRQVAKLGRYIDNLDKEEQKNYSNYRWTVNKIKQLNKIFTDCIRSFQADSISLRSEKLKKICRKGLKDIINHLNRVLSKEININEKIENPVLKEEPNILLNTRHYQKLIYNVMNQYHPKFLDKLPQNVQFYIHKAMRYMVEKLTQELEKFS